MSKDEIPSITFRVNAIKTSIPTASTSGDARYRAEVILSATYKDHHLWKEVSDKLVLNGLKIQTVQDLDSEIQQILREKITSLEAQVLALTNQLEMQKILVDVYKPAVIPKKAGK